MSDPEIKINRVVVSNKASHVDIKAWIASQNITWLTHPSPFEPGRPYAMGGPFPGIIAGGSLAMFFPPPTYTFFDVPDDVVMLFKLTFA